MASGRIQPGSRQWVEAMRRLSGTEDTTVDMSMGRKVSRDAAIPHGMGTAALDTRLRGDGPGPVYPPCGSDFDAQNPNKLPVGNDWVKIVAYGRSDLGPENGGIRWTVWAELTGAAEPIIIRQPASTWGVQNGLIGIPMINAPWVNEAEFTFTDDDGKTASFCILMPTDMEELEHRPASFVPPLPPVEPFEFENGLINRWMWQRNGWFNLRGGRRPFTSDAPPEWDVRIPNNSGPTWSGAPIPDGPQTMTITDADGSTVKVTFDYTDIADGEQRPITEVTLAQQVQAIIGTTAGFAFDPFDFATNLTTGNVPATALGQPILRQNAKWGSAPGFFSGGGVRPEIEEQGLIHPVSATANAATNGDAVLRGFFRNRSAVFICQAMQVPRRPAARAHAMACSQVSGALGRMTLHTDNDLSVTFNYRRTDLGDGAGKVELPPNTLVPGERTVVSCAVDFANGGARIWKDGVLGGSSAVPAAGGNLEDTLCARVRSGAFTAGGVNEFFEGGLGRAVVLPFIPSAAQRAVIEAWVAEPAEVALATVANPTLTERVQAILRQTKGFALDPQDLATLWQDDEAITPVTAPGQPVGAIRSKFGNASYTYRATDPIVTTYEGGAISFAGADGGLINPSDNFTTGNTGMVVVARVAAEAGQQDDAPVVAFLGVGGGTRLALELKSDLRPAFSVARPDANELQITGTAPMTPGQAHTLSVRALFFGTPAPVQGFLDGVLAAEGVLTGTPAVTDAPVAPFGGLGQWGDTALQFSGYVGRVVFAHFFQTDKDRQVFEAWVAEGPWPAVPPG